MSAPLNMLFVLLVACLGFRQAFFNNPKGQPRNAILQGHIREKLRGVWNNRRMSPEEMEKTRERQEIMDKREKIASRKPFVQEERWLEDEMPVVGAADMFMRNVLVVGQGFLCNGAQDGYLEEFRRLNGRIEKEKGEGKEWV